jgi:hypothetical protein
MAAGWRVNSTCLRTSALGGGFFAKIVKIHIDKDEKSILKNHE